jgi:flagellar biosynthesis protein FlhA
MISLDPELEHVLQQATNLAGVDAPGIEPGLANTLLSETARAFNVEMAPTALWSLIAYVHHDTLSTPGNSQLQVIAVSEVPDNRTIRVNATVGGRA